MPIQAPQWTDYLNCPVCCREFGAPPRSPISLGCGHTLCKHCLKHLHRKQCPFDQTVIQVEPEELVVNTALLQLAGYSPPTQPYHPPSIQALSDHDRQAYDCIVKCMEHLAAYLKYCGNVNNSMAGNRLSRPMQRKLVMLLQCAITDEDGRGRAARAARSLGERTVTELILQHQNPQQLSANLWAAVRARGCQFLGPAMQEEVLKLVLLALEDGSALSRKVLVMFVVQRLEPHFPQASKTSIGHVVQLLYRASCFKVSKRECDSSLMQLKEEFRTYESLRREHDAQIVQIATEAGLRIAPDQWSALLYGDTAHKSHMQSIIDKLQTPQSFAQSVQELFIALQRTGDPAQLIVMSLHLDRLANIDASPDVKSPSWQQLAEVMTSLKEVVAGLIHYLQQQAQGRDSNHNQKHNLPDRCLDNTNTQGSPQTSSTPTHAKYKVSMCRDAAARSFCPRGNACTFAHSEEELERFREYLTQINGNYTFIPIHPNSVPTNITQGMPIPPPFPRYPVPQPAIIEPHNLPGYPAEIGENNHPQPPAFINPHQRVMAGNKIPIPHNEDMGPAYYHQYNRMPEEHRANVAFNPDEHRANVMYIPDEHRANVPYIPDEHRANVPFIHEEHRGGVQFIPEEHRGGVQFIPEEHRGNVQFIPEEHRANVPFRAELCPPPFAPQNNIHLFPPPEVAIAREDLYNLGIPANMMPEYRVNVPPGYPNILMDRADAVWAPNPREVFHFGDMRCTLPAPVPNEQSFTTRAFPSTSRHSSPEVASPRAVGGPVSGGPNGSSGTNGPSPVPVNRQVPIIVVSRAIGADRAPNERATVSERLSAAAAAYHVTGFDDQELEAGLQALERRIDTEFKNAD